MIELEHSPLGGSSASRFLNCDFYFLEYRRQLMAGTYLETPSEYASLGTAAHELAALCLTTETEPFEHLGEEFGGWRAGFPQEIELDAVSVYVDFCREWKAKAPAGTKVYIEKTFHLPRVHPLLKGTVDFGLVAQNWLAVIDYKNGEGIGVSAYNNTQLMYYAFILVMAQEYVSREMKIFLGIVQPNYYGVFEEPEVWETTVGVILDWGNTVLLPVMRNLASEPVDRAGNPMPGEWCQFCPVMLHCPKLKQAFEDYSDADEDFITMLTDAELDALYARREQARRFMNALEQTVYARKVTGGNIPSAKLVEKKVARVWKPGALAILLKTFGDKAYAPRKELSPAGIEKLSTRGKELAKEYGYKPETHSLTIAPLSDPRAEAAPRTNANVFSAFEQSYTDMEF